MSTKLFTEALESRLLMSASSAVHNPAVAAHRPVAHAESMHFRSDSVSAASDMLTDWTAIDAGRTIPVRAQAPRTEAAASTRLPAPVVTSPGGTASPGPVLTISDPTFTWQAVTGVSFTGYQINLEDLTKNRFVSYQVGKSATQFTPAAGALAAGDKFVWNLRLRNGDTTGPKSAYFHFQTPGGLIAPTIVGPGIAESPSDAQSPGPVLTTATPTLTWKAVTGVSFTGYQINLEDLTADKFVSYQVDKSATQFTPPAGALAAGDKFVWNLRLRNGDTTGPESAYFFFQTPGGLVAPTIVGPGIAESPGPELTTSDPTFTWQAVTGVSFTGYQINLEDLTAGKFVSYQVDASATQFTPPAGALAAGDKFVWNLRLRNGDTTGPESAYFYFQTP